MKKILLPLIFLAVASCLTLNIEELTKNGYERMHDNFGNVLLGKSTELNSESVLLKMGNVLEDPVLYENFLTSILNHPKVDRTPELIKCAKGNKAEFFKFGAIEVGFIGNQSATEHKILDRLEDDCFGKVEVNFTYTKKNAINTVVVNMRASNKKKAHCTEGYILGTGANFHVTTFILKNEHTFTWTNLNEVEINNVLTWGIHIFRLCDEVKHWLPDLIKTA